MKTQQAAGSSTRSRWLAGRRPLLLITALLLAAPAAKAGDSCRVWRGEHRAFKARVAGLYLAGATQSALDGAMFELLQREAYLTSCSISVENARDELVGWRLAGRARDRFASAVIESMLARSGFDLALVRLVPSVAAPARVATTRPRRRARSR